MRKLLTKTTILAVIATAVLTVSAAAAEIGTGVITATSLRLREEPSTEAATIMLLEKGASVSVHEQLDGWYKVIYNGTTGYVSGDYLTFTANSEDTAVNTDVPNTDAETAAVTEYTHATIGGSAVNFRAEPSTEAAIITRLEKDTEIELVAVEDGWCKVVYDGQTGYISADYVAVNGVAVQGAQGIVNGSHVNVRSGPSTEYDVVTRLSTGTIVDLSARVGDWYAIRYDDVTGYISADYVYPYTAAASSAIADQVVALAKSLLGVPYAYGGQSPSGFDCSGFTSYVYQQFGYSLPHSATSQWYSSGVTVQRGELQPGDLVMFCDPSRSNGKACSHVGIYIGNSEFIHASSGSSGKYVRISSLNEDYYNRYYKGAKRLG